jgi:hypothetical protein
VTAPSPVVVRVLAVLAVLELLSLAVLLTNLFTVHLRPVTQTMGPVHGAVYLAVVVIVLFAPGFRVVDRVLGCIPVVGGAITVRRAVLLRRAGRAR